MHAKRELLRIEFAEHQPIQLGREDFGGDHRDPKDHGHDRDHGGKSFARFVFSFFREKARVDGNESD